MNFGALEEYAVPNLSQHAGISCIFETINDMEK
jgi:hypothetical protein